HLFKRQLAGEDDAREAEAVQGGGAGAVVDRQLRAGVQFQRREVAAHQVINAQVLDDEGVHADVGEVGDVVHQFGQFVLANEGVDGDEDAAARLQAVGVGGDLGDLVQGEVLGLGAGGEFFQAQVDGVGAVVEGG